MREESKAYYVYLVKCSDDTLYCGYTTNVEKRIATHNKGKGAKYTRARRPVSLVYNECFETKNEALRREIQIKKMTRKEKLYLIQKGYKNG